MSNPTLPQLLDRAAFLRRSIRDSEESRQAQRTILGTTFPKTEGALWSKRRALAATTLEASRLSRDAGQVDQALELLREHAALAHLLEGHDLRSSAGQA